MSQENVEVVRQSLDAYVRRDVAAMRKLNHPEMELDWSASRSWLAGVYHGFDEALRFYEGYFEVFARIEIEPSSFIEVGESVVVPNLAQQWGRDGIAVSAKSTFVFTLRRGRIVRTCLFQTTEQALEACRDREGVEPTAEGED